jgi:hypothetical protein
MGQGRVSAPKRLRKADGGADRSAFLQRLPRLNSTRLNATTRSGPPPETRKRCFVRGPVAPPYRGKFATVAKPAGHEHDESGRHALTRAADARR